MMPTSLLHVTYLYTPDPGFIGRYKALCTGFRACGWEHIDTDIIALPDRAAMVTHALMPRAHTDVLVFDPSGSLP